MGVFRRGFQDMFLRDKWKIMRGDKVQLLAGRDAGQVGTVLKVIRSPKWPRVVVEGQNLHKRFIKRTKDNPGGVVSVEAPLHYSNVALVDPVTNAPVRVSWRYLEDGTKVRVTRGKLASNSIIEPSPVLKQRRKPRMTSQGPKDTALADAAAVTHTPGDLPSVLKQQLQQQAAGAAPAGAAAHQHQHQRGYHAAAAAAAAATSSGGSVLAVLTTARLFGGRLLPLACRWRGFAAGSLP